jgi:hypothetical protein
MPPPPLPKQPGKKTVTHRVVYAGLVVLVLLSLIGYSVQRSIERQGKRTAAEKAAKEMDDSIKEISADTKNSYDPEKGITNLNLTTNQLARLQQNLQTASRGLDEEDAASMQALSNHVARMQKVITKYQAAARKLSETSALDPLTLTNKTQLEPRREAVREFLVANTEFADFTKNAEKTIRTGMEKAGLSERRIESTIKSYRSNAAAKNPIVLQMRRCEQRIGDASLGILDLFESEWGKWHYDTTSELIDFGSSKANETFSKLMQEINEAKQEGIQLQGKLVRMQ